MTAPAEQPRAGEIKSGGFAQLVRWLNDERPAGSDDTGFVTGAPRRVARWTYGDPPSVPKPEIDRDVLGEVRIGPAPRCAIAGETIALSVSLISTTGRMFLGWPVKLEWVSSDPSVATVDDHGIVEVHARGRVELTCTCEGKSGSVLLTVVEPSVAVAVGLPVPARLLPRGSAGERPAFPELTASLAAPAPRAAASIATPPARVTGPELASAGAPTSSSAPITDWVPLPELPPVHRRSVERGSVKHGVAAALIPSRGTRRLVFRLAVGAATGAFVAVALSQSPEDYFVVDGEPAAAVSGVASARASTVAGRQSAVVAGVRPRAVATSAARALAGTPLLGDTSRGAMLAATGGRTVSEAAGSTVVTAPATAAPAKTATEKPSVAAPPPPAQPPAAPVVSRVVVASSPSQLTEGESVRLSAAGVDDRGTAVAGRAVTWTSEDTDVAVIDANGVVTARRPGTVTFVATSEGRTGRVTLSVGARRAAPAPEAAVPSAAPSRENGPAAAAPVMRARVDEFVQALRERNTARVAALYQAESPQDRRNLQALLERLRRPEARLKASDPQLAAPEVREMEAAAEFQVPMSWTTPFGRVRTQTATFRAVLEPGDGGWRLVAIRAVGKID